VVIPDFKGYSVIKLSELIMCEADGYCTHFYLSGKRKITSTKSIKYFEELFAGHHLFRVHRSFLVNLSKITGYTRQGEIHLEENFTCPIGQNYKQDFIEKMGR
jgi:two-component system LytT family response regulator